MSEEKTFSQLIGAITNFAKKTCLIKLTEMFPDAPESVLAKAADELALHCIPIQSRQAGIKPFYSIMQPLSEYGKKLIESKPSMQHESMASFCSFVMEEIEKFHAAISQGKYDPTDFIKHFQDGKGES